MLRTLWINLLVLLAGLAVLEIGFGGWIFRGPLDVLPIPRDTDISYDVQPPDLPGWRARYRRDRWGLRGNFERPEDIRLLTLGGSTTDQRLLSQEDSWQGVAAAELRRAGMALAIGNAGVDGQSSIGHLRALELWLPNIPGLRPSTVLVYVGINDEAVGADSPFDTMMGQAGWRRAVTDRSALYRLWRTLRGMVAAEHYSLSHDLQRQPAEDWRPAPEAKVDPAVLAAYGERLRELGRRIRAMGARPVFVTQPKRDLRLDQGRAWSRNGAGTALLAYNRTLLEVCADEHLTCLDLAAELRFEPGDFYDTLHNTPQGAARIGRWLAARLRPVIAGH